jgi:hypothetical protein
LLGFSFAAILIGPLAETIDLTPTREYRAPYTSSKWQEELSLPFSSVPDVWKLIVVSCPVLLPSFPRRWLDFFSPQAWQMIGNTPENLTKMLTLNSTWQTQESIDFPSQVIGSVNWVDHDDYPPTQKMVFDCSTFPLPSFTGTANSYLKVGQSWTFGWPNTLPDLFLRVNFSGLLPLQDRPQGSGRFIPEESLKVYSAFTNNTKDVLATTRPVLLLPGMNLMVGVDLVIRKRFRNPELSAFGLFDVSLWNL